MSTFLDQDEIDRLQDELLNVKAKKDKAQIARDSIKEMYYDTLGVPLVSSLLTMEDIGECIDTLHIHITTSSKYYEGFSRLKTSYLHRV